MDKEQLAIARLRDAARLSEHRYKKQLMVTYSGGKDSQLLVALAERAGIDFEVVNSHTTADAPETVYFIREQFKATVKAVVAHYDASSLISNRDAVASQMDTKLREVLAEYNIDLQYISVTNFDFTDTFTDAVEAKVKAQQEKEKAETDAEKRRVEAQATADADLIAANAEAEKSKVAADAELYVAEKKAEANRALNDSLNSNLLEYYRITNVDSLWNGELPTYVGGDGSIPIINGIN